MKKNYFLQTDILPFELPMLFSNSQLYNNKNFSEYSFRKMINNITIADSVSYDKHFLELDDLSLKELDDLYTKPLHFNIQVSDKKTRQLSLLHPLGQLKAFQFVVMFEKNILIAGEKSNYSVRSPYKKNENKISLSQIQKKKITRILNSFSKVYKEDILSEDMIIKYRHYFSYNKVSQIKELLSRSYFQQSQRDYKYVLKVDIQNFFPSIYTHSLSWALYGSKSFGKLQRGDKYSFPNQADSTLQNINFGETNGIVVGPEFSRIMSELVMGQIDINVEKKLYEKNIIHHKHYELYRFIDDMYIFVNDTTIGDKILTEISQNLLEFNLNLNTSKEHLYKNTFELNFSTTDLIKEAIENFTFSRSQTFVELKLQDKFRDLTIDDIRGKLSDWKILFTRVIRVLSSSSTDEIRKGANYFLSALLNLNKTKLANPLDLHSINDYQKFVELYISNLISILKLSPNRMTYIHFGNNIITLINNSNISDDFDESPVQIEIFQIIFDALNTIFSSEWFDITQGYDLFPILRFFSIYNMDISFSKLKSFFENINLDESYFVYTAIGYYMLDYNNNTHVRERYLHFIKEFFNSLKERINLEESKGINTWRDASFFYILNDFSKYPPFNERQQKFFETKMDVQQLCSDSKLFINNITKESYYNWNANFEELKEKIILKKIISQIQTVDYE